MITSEDLHRAADYIDQAVQSPELDALTQAGAAFIMTTNLTTEDGTKLNLDPPSVGYGIVLGYLAATGPR
jgi:hypothetical protein